MVQKVPRSHQRLRRQSTHCHWCNQELANAPGYENSFTRDHVVPKSNGGSFRIQNIVASCERCNRYRGDMPAAEFARLIAEYPLSPATEDLTTEKGRLRASWKHKHWREQWAGKTAPEPSLGAQLAAAINEPTEGEMQDLDIDVRITEPHVVIADDTLSLYEVSKEDDEPRVRDIDLAIRLGMKSPYDIRRMVRNHHKKLSEINELVETSAINSTNGTRFTEFYLDRKQATFLAIRSNTPESDNVAMQLVEIYDRWRKGTLPMHPQATANVATDAMVAILTQIRDGVQDTNRSIGALRDDHDARMTALEDRIHGLERRAALPPPASDEPTVVKLAHWCEAKGIDYGTASRLGQKVGCRIASIADDAGLPLMRQPFTGRRLYPSDFLDQHADQIRGWLS